MAEYIGVPDTPISPSGQNVWGINTAVPQAQPQTIGSIPSLPNLSPLPDFLPTEQWLPKAWNSVTGLFTKPVQAAATAFSILTDPGRVITVAIGLLFIFGAMYLLGTSQIENAIRKAVK